MSDGVIIGVERRTLSEGRMVSSVVDLWEEKTFSNRD